VHPWITALALLLCAGAAAAGTTRYVSDDLEITLRSGQSTRHEILRLLPAGTRLEVLEDDRETGYARVRTPSGVEGWVLRRYLVAQPPARVRLPGIEARLKEVEAARASLAKELEATRAELEQTRQEMEKLRDENSRLKVELTEIRRVSARHLETARRLRELEARLATASREAQILRQENENLRDRSNRDWFVVGAIVVVISMLLGILLTRIRWRRKSSWGDL